MARSARARRPFASQVGVAEGGPGLCSYKQLWEMCPCATGVSSACSVSQDCEGGGDHADCVSISGSFFFFF